MHKGRCTSISVDAARDLISAELEDRGHHAHVDVLFDEIVYRSGLLTVVDECRLEFRHHLIQEFFAGRAVKRASTFKYDVADEWWRTPIVFHFGESADDSEGLGELRELADALMPGEVFEAAITLGLAVQASYLTPRKLRQKEIAWVVQQLSDEYEHALKKFSGDGSTSKLAPFISYYMAAKDAVACDLLLECEELDKLGGGDRESELVERDLFWRCAGQIEAGRLDEAEGIVKAYQPKDLRYLLALHMGCFTVENLKYSEPSAKRIAKDISKKIAPKITHLIDAYIEEWKQNILELRRVENKAIEADAQRVGRTQGGKSDGQ